MNKGIELLVIDKLSGEIKHRLNETFSFEDGVLPTPDQYLRFEQFGHGICRLLAKNSNFVIQISATDLQNLRELGLFTPVSSRRANYVHFHEMG